MGTFLIRTWNDQSLIVAFDPKLTANFARWDGMLSHLADSTESSLYSIPP